MAVEPSRDHHCGWRTLAERQERELGRLAAEQQQVLEEQGEVIAALQARVRELEALLHAEPTELAVTVKQLQAEVAKLQRQLSGRRSEKIKIPSAERDLDSDEEPSDEERARRAEETARKRRQRAVERSASMQEEEVVRTLLPSERKCTKCGGEQFTEIGYETSVLYDYVPGHFVRRTHKRQKMACRCGECILTAAAPPKVIKGGRYGTGFAAFLIVDKIADSIPIYRVEKRLKRLGIPISRSTMNDVLHDAAQMLFPLAKRLLAKVRDVPVVLADETSMRMMDRPKRGFYWVFQGTDDETGSGYVLYRFAADRSGQTPATVLGGTDGTLVVDGYTGYNVVTDPDGRLRAGCWSHARRKLYEAMLTGDQDAVEAIDLIRELFRVEHEALVRGIVRTDEHLQLRKERSKPITDNVLAWVKGKRASTPPKSPLGEAVGYVERQWSRLTLFLTDPRVPIHNNESERAMRIIALGRKNWLFVGHPRAGRNLAVLLSLVGSCVANGVEPTAYFTDVLGRVHEVKDDPDALDRLLPDRWSPAN
jgi:transposase